MAKYLAPEWCKKNYKYLLILFKNNLFDAIFPFFDGFYLAIDNKKPPK